jgi:hypothetical protein
MTDLLEGIPFPINCSRLVEELLFRGYGPWITLDELLTKWGEEFGIASDGKFHHTFSASSVQEVLRRLQVAGLGRGPGRPSVAEDGRVKRSTVTLPEALVDQLDQEAAGLGISRSELLRRILADRAVAGSTIRLQFGTQETDALDALAASEGVSRKAVAHQMIWRGAEATRMDARIREVSAELPTPDQLEQLVTAIAQGAPSPALIQDEDGIRLVEQSTDEAGAVVMDADGLAVVVGPLALMDWAYEPGGDERGAQMTEWIQTHKELLEAEVGRAQYAAMALAYALQVGPVAVLAMAKIISTRGY